LATHKTTQMALIPQAHRQSPHPLASHRRLPRCLRLRATKPRPNVIHSLQNPSMTPMNRCSTLQLATTCKLSCKEQERIASKGTQRTQMIPRQLKIPRQQHPRVHVQETSELVQEFSLLCPRASLSMPLSLTFPLLFLYYCVLYMYMCVYLYSVVQIYDSLIPILVVNGCPFLLFSSSSDRFLSYSIL
jgi:hypothetical protein